VTSSSRRSEPRPRDLQADATRAALISSARTLFVEQGYAATSTQALVLAAGVGTRGALYHHFPDKEALFAAVFEAIQADLGRDINERVGSGHTNLLDRLLATLTAFLDCVLESDEARALLRDGPAALGWEGFRAAEARFGVAPLQSLLDRAIEKGAMVSVPTEPLARIIVAILDDAALAISVATDPGLVRQEWSSTITALIDGLATTPPKARRGRAR